MAAFVLGMPEHKVRVISPDVGGGFGSKIFLYPEEVTVSWASKQLGRPVKWTAERRESFMTDAHGRDHITEAEMAVDQDGKIVALRVNTNANLGAYLSTFAPLDPDLPLRAAPLGGVQDSRDLLRGDRRRSPTRRRSTPTAARAVPRRRISSSGCAT